MAGGRSVSEQESDRVRAALRELVAREGTQGAAALKLGVSQQTISNVLKGKPAGYALARAVARARKIKNVDAWLKGGEEPPPGAPRLGAIALWAELEPEARRVFNHVPPWAFEAVRNLEGENLPAAATVAMIGQMAAGWAARANDDERAAAIRAHAEREMAEIDARAAADAQQASAPPAPANDSPRGLRPGRPRRVR